VHGNEVAEAQLAREPIRTAEGLGRECGQVVDVIGPSGAEERLQERVGEDAVVKELLEAVERFFAAGMFEQCGHRSKIDSGGADLPGRRAQGTIGCLSGS
jgi:hypothetical protein